MNQSAEATVWPLSRVRLSAGSVPRMLIFSPWPKALSMVMPGSEEIASATLVEGNLPTSSAVITSMIASALRLVSSACCRLARMPVTTTRSSSLALPAVAEVSCSWAAVSCACTSGVTPRHTAIAADSMDLRCFMAVLSITKWVWLLDAAGRIAFCQWHRCRMHPSWAGTCAGTLGGGAVIRSCGVLLVQAEVPAGGAKDAKLPVLDQGHGNAFERLAH